MLLSLLNKKDSNLFSEIIESKRPEMYSGNKNRGSPSELNIYREVNILLILISEDKKECVKIDIKLVMLLVESDKAFINKVNVCIFFRYSNSVSLWDFILS